MKPICVLFVCSDNSCRSQMAEGFLRRYGGGSFDVHSAGLTSAPIHPTTVEVMARSGIDLASHDSKPVRLFQDRHFDFVITVCPAAREQCPDIPGARLIHWRFDDPLKASGSPSERRRAFMRTRDEIASRVRLFAYAQSRSRERQPDRHPGLATGTTG